MCHFLGLMDAEGVADITARFAKHHISQKNRILCVDALNQAHRFFSPGKKWTIPQEAFRRVSKFVQAAKNSGWNLLVFIDSKTVSGKAQLTWKKRREKEVEQRKRNMPQGTNVLLGDLFSRCNVEVHYSLEADCDDTVAAFAHASNGAILSADRDMFRYQGAQLEVFADFEYKNGELVLYHHTNCTPKSSRRQILSPPPKTSIRLLDFELVRVSGQYLRGSPSPLTRDMGNLHIKVRPLRQALYSHLHFDAPITEEFPVWNEERCQVEWDVQSVAPDSTYSSLLKDPQTALKTFFPDWTKPPNVSEKNWFNHVFAAKEVVFELISATTGQSVLEMMEAEFHNQAKPAKPRTVIFSSNSPLTLSRKLRIEEIGTTEEIEEGSSKVCISWKRSNAT